MEIEEGVSGTDKKERGNRQKKKERTSVGLSCREYRLFLLYCFF